MACSIAFVDDTDILRMSVANLLEQMQPQYKVYQSRSS